MPAADHKYLIGVISDTHGRLPPSTVEAFSNVDLIIHAGDIGDPDILKSLEKIAPTKAVRGNMDNGSWAHRLPKNEVINIDQIRLYVLHDVYGFEMHSASAEYDVVVSGHTHRPKVEKKRGILYINPGSAVLPRSGYPPSVALLRIQNKAIQVRLIELKE